MLKRQSGGECCVVTNPRQQSLSSLYKQQNEAGFRLYVNEAASFGRINVEEERQLADRISRGDEVARERMICSNLLLVVKIANDYTGMGLPLLDLINEGNIGLMKAADRFRTNKGAKFSTYAAWWIKQAIRRALSNQSRNIRLPIQEHQKSARFRRRQEALLQKFGREPYAQELSVDTGIPVEEVHRLKDLPNTVSMSSPLLSDEHSGTIEELIADPNVEHPVEVMEKSAWPGEMRKLLEGLDERERRVLTRRFGLDGNEPDTLEVIGVSYRVTRERIRQIQSIALEKMRIILARRRRTISDTGFRRPDGTFA